jgi:hypothetical protein
LLNRGPGDRVASGWTASPALRDAGTAYPADSITEVIVACAGFEAGA